MRRKAAVRALSWDQVETIRQHFARHNPYKAGKITGTVLKLEEVNLDTEGHQRLVWCYAISAKRYCLYTLEEQGEPQLVKWSEHGFGHLLNPIDPESEDRDWMCQIWEGLLREELGLAHEWPAWLDRPALSRLTISSPELLKPFADLNAGKAWPDQVKPFSFLLVGHARPFGYPAGMDPARFQLVAPFELEASRWLHLPWIDRYSGTRVAVSTSDEMHDPQRALLQSFRDVIREFRTHPEVKSADTHGRACDRRTRGLLRRRVVQETYVAHMGKEANKLEEVQAGFERNSNLIYTVYRKPDPKEWWAEIVAIMRQLPAQRLAEESGVSIRTIKALRNGH